MTVVVSSEITIRISTSDAIRSMVDAEKYAGAIQDRLQGSGEGWEDIKEIEVLGFMFWPEEKNENEQRR